MRPPFQVKAWSSGPSNESFLVASNMERGWFYLGRPQASDRPPKVSATFSLFSVRDSRHQGCPPQCWAFPRIHSHAEKPDKNNSYSLTTSSHSAHSMWSEWNDSVVSVDASPRALSVSRLVSNKRLVPWRFHAARRNRSRHAEQSSRAFVPHSFFHDLFGRTVRQ